MDGLLESAHRQLMVTLAYAGRRSEALRQFQICRDSLRNELGVDPSVETLALYESILSGELNPESSPSTLSNSTNGLNRPFPSLVYKAGEAERSAAFVGREQPLASLETHLESTLLGQGKLVFIIGSAGEGKTSLLVEFARRAQKDHPDLIIAAGNCSTYIGLGDPYQPFLEILDHLLGTRRSAADTLQALLEHGPALVEKLVPIKNLTSLADALPGSQGHTLAEAIRRRAEQLDLAAGVNEPAALFEQLTRVLRVIAARSPLLLVLDDLQWADEVSLGMLFHLSRRLQIVV